MGKNEINDTDLMRIEKSKNYPMLPELESSHLIRPSKFAFVNRRRAEVFRTAAETIREARNVIDETIQLEISYRNLKNIDSHFEFEAEKREFEREKLKLEKEKIKLETEQIRYTTKMLKKRKGYNHREDYDEEL